MKILRGLVFPFGPVALLTLSSTLLCARAIALAELGSYDGSDLSNSHRATAVSTRLRVMVQSTFCPSIAFEVTKSIALVVRAGKNATRQGPTARRVETATLSARTSQSFQLGATQTRMAYYLFRVWLFRMLGNHLRLPRCQKPCWCIISGLLLRS